MTLNADPAARRSYQLFRDQVEPPRSMLTASPLSSSERLPCREG